MCGGERTTMIHYKKEKENTRVIEKKLWFVFTRCSLQQCKKGEAKQETHIRKQKIQRKKRENERKRGKKMNNGVPVIGRRVVVSDAKTTGRRRKKKEGGLGSIHQLPAVPLLSLFCCRVTKNVHFLVEN